MELSSNMACDQCRRREYSHPAAVHPPAPAAPTAIPSRPYKFAEFAASIFTCGHDGATTLRIDHRDPHYARIRAIATIVLLACGSADCFAAGRKDRTLMTDPDVVVIGAGAAGLAAARRLKGTGLTVRVIEARTRVGGRAWTVSASGTALDLGCGWLHSAIENEWTALAEDYGFTIDTTTPAWAKPALDHGFPADQQAEFRAALDDLFDRIEQRGDDGPDRSAADFVPAGSRWRDLLDAVSTWINGVELASVSVHDVFRYADTGVNWRLRQGYGALVAAAADGLEIVRDCAATTVDHAGRQVRIETTRGTTTTRAVIITLPSDLLAAEALRFSPALPAKTAAAAALPLGVADKLFVRVADAADLPVERRLYGATDGAIASFHLRPFGSDLIEVYMGGALARELEDDDGRAMFAFATDQLTARLGGGMRKRLGFVAASAWARDPLSRGAYSYARVGACDMRAVLAAPVDGRLFFAGEATSRHDFSTAHGAYRTGVRAAEEALAALAQAPRR
jgi:monoamine oxidase